MMYVKLYSFDVAKKKYKDKFNPTFTNTILGIDRHNWNYIKDICDRYIIGGHPTKDRNIVIIGCKNKGIEMAIPFVCVKSFLFSRKSEIEYLKNEKE